ncbi:MAG TPA: hypothetical protein VJ817_13855 [Gemmatimonadales bacterium]|nr:hypothetical protein [Gemmatimonadales bacterium]
MNPLISASPWILALGLVAAACSAQAEPSEPPPGFEYAYAGPSCAPWDGHAVMVVLRGAPLAPGDSAIEAGPAPQLRLALYPRSPGISPSGLNPGTYRWPGETEVAIGSICQGGSCSTATSGKVTLHVVGTDGRLRGSAELTLPDAGTIRGSFDAEWRSRQMYCL